MYILNLLVTLVSQGLSARPCPPTSYYCLAGEMYTLVTSSMYTRVTREMHAAVRV